MAHNDFAKLPAGVWSDLDVPTSAQFTTMDQNGATAVNGDAGGAWAPTAPIDVGGLGLRARLRYDLIATGANADHTYDPVATRLVYCDNTITGDRAYTISVTNALVGDVFEVRALSTMNIVRTVTVKDDAGTALITIGTGPQCDATWAQFILIGSHFVLLESGKPINRVMYTPSLRLGAGVTTSSAGYTDVPGLSTTLAVKPGDLLVIDVGGGLGFTGSAGGAASSFKLYVDEGAGTDLGVVTAPSGASTVTAATGWAPISLHETYTCTTTGSVTVKCQFNAGNAANTAYVDGDGAGLTACPHVPSTLRVVQIRP